MQTVLLVVHLLIAIALCGIILMQKSEGGALGIGGGGGNGGLGNIFSARGVGNALTRATAFLAVAFFATSIGLTLIATRGQVGQGSAFDNVQTPAQQQEGGTPPVQPDGGSVLPNIGQQAPQVPTNQ
jgi:preprotein translocase subunit SecG